MKTIEMAKKAKSLGYVYIASIVKNVYTTNYYHVVKIDDVLAAQKWIPAEKVSMMPWHGRIGQSWLPEKTILRTQLYSL